MNRFHNQSTTYNAFREVFHLLSDPKLILPTDGSDGTLEREDDVEMMNLSRRDLNNSLSSSNTVTIDFDLVIQYLTK